jgi:hypothetical protein
LTQKVKSEFYIFIFIYIYKYKYIEFTFDFLCQLESNCNTVTV